MKRKPRAAKGPRRKATPNGATNPALEALPPPTVEPTAPQAGVLAAIGALGKAANQLAIARQTGLTREALREKLAALERKGYIRPVHKRVVARFTLTDKGKTHLEPYGPGVDGPDQGQGIDAPWLEDPDTADAIDRA